MNAPDYAARAAPAAAGAAYLDQHRPGWAERINLGCLDLASECGCVLGQLGGVGYTGMRRELGLEPDDAVTLGFSLGTGRPWGDWALLDGAWTAEITRRREPAQLCRAHPDDCPSHTPTIRRRPRDCRAAASPASPRRRRESC